MLRKQLLVVVAFCCGVAVVSASAAGATEPVKLWNPDSAMPASDELESVDDVRFSVIKRHEPEKDGYDWLHGVALAWHRGRLVASFGLNPGRENTVTEQAYARFSTDGGRTWGELVPIDRGTDELAVSHGGLLSHDGELWAYQGCFRDRRKDVHTLAYLWDAEAKGWRARGVVARKGFWPMGRPRRMGNGDFIMAGIQVQGGWGSPKNPPAVAISSGDDLAEWEVVTIPKPDELVVWGESAVIVDGRRVGCIARSWTDNPVALASRSRDYGRSWTMLRDSNMPMTTSKPCAGTLSTGQRFLICTTTSDCGNRRHPLTIALAPAEGRFEGVLEIRGAVHDGPGESTPKARLSYPTAVEHDGNLYVGYSNDGGRGGNRNSAELAVIPVESLR